MKTVARLQILAVMIIWMIPAPLSAQSFTSIQSIAWNPSGTILALGGVFEDQVGLTLLDADGQLIYHVNDPYGAQGISWRQDGNQVAYVNSVGTFSVHDANTGSIIVSFAQSGTTSDNFIHWNPANFDQFATVERDVVHLREANTGNILISFDGSGGFPDSILSVGWSPSGSNLYTVSTDDVIRVWDVNNGTEINTIQLNYRVSSFAMSPDTTMLAIGGADGQLRIHNSETGLLLPEYTNLLVLSSPNNILHLTWNQDSTQVAGTSSQEIMIWDTQTGQVVNSIPHQTATLQQEAITFSPNGTLTYPSSNEASTQSI